MRVIQPSDDILDVQDNLVLQLRNRRKKLGLSQMDVAKLMGHHDRSMLCNWETGKYAPRTAMVLLWASVLGLRLALVETGENS